MQKHLPWVIALLTIVLIPAGAALAQSPTNTPTPSVTPSITPTYNNATRTILETIAPPPSCGSVYNPCSALPWAVPVLPTLSLPSPTIWPTFTAVPITATPTVTLTLATVATGVATTTPTPNIDLSGIQTAVRSLQDQVATMEAAATVDILDGSGTPVTLNDLSLSLATNVPGMFSAVKGLQAATNNRTLGLVSFALTVLMFLVVVNLIVLFLPVILRVVQFILQLIQALKPF